MKILIGADFVPTQSNAELFAQGNIKALTGEELESVLISADFRIFNLEVPLTDTLSPIDKCGPALIASTASVNGYKAARVDLLTLANNHIFDQDEQGFYQTVETLKQAEIATVGGGATLAQARAPYIFHVDGKKIGVYACAEHEFSIATQTTCGANPFDPLESLDHIRALKDTCDFVIVLYHGGKEHYRYPSPNLQKVCRKIVDKGADLVLCQHTHCVGCEEKYGGGTIVYGQGNFLFDKSDNEYWGTSLLVEIKDDFEIGYIPLEKAGKAVRLAQGEKAKEILDGFYKRSEEIKDTEFIQKQYSAFAKERLEGYLFAVSGIKRGFLFRALNKISGYRLAKWILKRRYKKQTLLAVRNYIECEAHSELFLQGVKGEIENNGQ